MFSRSMGLRLFLFALLLFSGCGSSASYVPAVSGSGDSGSDGSSQTATVTLQSQLVLNRAISSNISTITFTTKSNTGATLFQSAPVEKTPVIKVEVPVDSKHLQLDYKDSSAQTKEIWGTPLPDLKAGDEVIIRQTNPDPVANLTKLEILGPSRIPAGLTQFRAQATYSDSSTRDVTNSVTWGGGARPDGVVDFTGQFVQTSVRVTATFGGLSASKSCLVVPESPRGLPFLLSGPSTSDAPVKSLTLNGCGDVRQLFVYSDFTDGIVREVTPECSFANLQPDVYLVDSRGLVRSINQGSTSISIRFGRNAIQVPLQVVDSPSLSVFGNPRESSQALTGTAGPLLIQDMNGDGLGDLITFASTGSGVDVSKVQISVGDGRGKFAAPGSATLPFSNGAGVTPVVFGGNIAGVTNQGVIGPFLAVGCSNSNSLAVVMRVRAGFSAFDVSLDSPVSEISMVPFSSDTTTRERLLVRTTSGSVHLVQVRIGSPSAADLVVPELKVDDKLIAIRNGRGNALVRGRSAELAVLPFTGTSVRSGDILTLPTGSTLVGMSSVVDANVLGFDALAQNGSGRSLVRYRLADAFVGGFTNSQVSGLPADAVLHPYTLNCGTERIFNIVTAAVGVPLLALDNRFEALNGLATLQTNPFAVGDLNADGFDDVVVLEAGNLRSLLMGP